MSFGGGKMPIKIWFVEPSPEWHQDAKCLGAETKLPGLFYPDQSNSETATAKAVCNGDDGFPPCPVKDQCLEQALTRPERYGVWGGKSERERRRILRARKIRRAKKAELEAKDQNRQSGKGGSSNGHKAPRRRTAAPVEISRGRKARRPPPKRDQQTRMVSSG
jgi:WhiB family transcriptional regulator, redox-sensing transcriptional regulator